MTLDALDTTEFHVGPSSPTAACVAAMRSASRASLVTPGLRGTRIFTPKDADTLNADAVLPASMGEVTDGVYTGCRGGATMSLRYAGIGSVGGGGFGPPRLARRLGLMEARAVEPRAPPA